MVRRTLKGNILPLYETIQHGLGVQLLSVKGENADMVSELDVPEGETEHLRRILEGYKDFLPKYAPHEL